MTKRWTVAALVAVVLTTGACAGEAVKKAAEKPAPAVVEKVDGSELSRVTVTPKAAERLGIQLAVVRAEGSRTALPYQAVIYDPEGRTWAYTSPRPGVFLRESVVVHSVVGGTAFLSAGPSAGTSVVTTGAAELYGTELGLGN